MTHANILQGVNTLSIELFCKEWKFITFQEALICIQNPKIHPLLKSAYFDYIVSAYVDLNVEESGIDIDNIWHCYVSKQICLTYLICYCLQIWSDICPDPIKAMNLADTFAIVPDAEEMRELQKSIREFLQQNKVILL